MKITVCLLNYNHAHTLKRALNSVLMQTYKDFELIISDDCSDDDSWDIINEYSSKFCNILALQTPKNLGMPGNANFAISNSNNDYIALLHHDDIFRKDLLEKWVNLVINKPNISFVFNDYYMEGKKETSHNDCRHIFKPVMSGIGFFRSYLISSGMGFGCYVWGSAFINKKKFNEIRGFNTQFGSVADIDLWMRLSLRGDVGYIDEPLITICHDRKDNYPNEYSYFSWNRLKNVYEIFAENILRFKGNRLNLLWFKYIFKLNSNITKWYIYGFIKNKKEILDYNSYRISRNIVCFLEYFRRLLYSIRFKD